MHMIVLLVEGKFTNGISQGLTFFFINSSDGQLYYLYNFSGTNLDVSDFFR
jgi:hypothetical protein